MSKKRAISYAEKQKLEEKKKKEKLIKRIVVIAIAVILVALLVVVVVNQVNKNNSSSDNGSSTNTAKADTTVTNRVEMSVKGYGIIKLELYGNEAPITVEHFMDLVESGYYDGTYFHRVIDDFMIQGGSKNQSGTSDGSATTIKGEFSSNGVVNNIKHEKGIISMARTSNNKDSASAQFFIMDNSNSSLDGNYAAFGKVYEGLDIVEAISAVNVTSSLTGEQSSPVEPITIEYIKEITE